MSGPFPGIQIHHTKKVFLLLLSLDLSMEIVLVISECFSIVYWFL